MIYFRRVATPLGIFLVASSEKGVCRIGLPGEDEGGFTEELERIYGKSYILDEDACGIKNPFNDKLREELMGYFEGGLREFTVPLDLRGTRFQRMVWREVLKIPYGRVKSYGQIAKALGKPGAARAVGMANNKNPLPILVPCHRVVGCDGSLVGYGGGLNLKKFLLKLEGVKFSGERCIIDEVS